MRIETTIKGWTTETEIEDGVVRIATSQTGSALEDAEAVQRDLASLLSDLALEDGVYWRATDDAAEPARIAARTQRASRDASTGRLERGLSVARHASYGVGQGYALMYRVSGAVIATGADGEPVLDLATVRVVSNLMAASAALSEHRAAEDKATAEYGFAAGELRRLAATVEARAEIADAIRKARS